MKRTTLLRAAIAVPAMVLAVALGCRSHEPGEPQVDETKTSPGPTDPANGPRYVDRLCTLVLKKRPEQQVTGTVVRYDAREVVVRTEDGRIFYTTPDDVLRITVLPDKAAASAQEPGARRDTFAYVLFEAKHRLPVCAPGFDKTSLEVPDTVTFVDKDSVLTVRVPPAAEPYHAHLFYKAKGELLEVVVDEMMTAPTRNGFQTPSGLIRIPLSDYPEPQHLIITSARTALREEPSGSAKESEVRHAILPPYVFSLKLLPADKADTLVPLQSFRHEVATPLGPLDHLVAPMNQGDMICTVIDRTKKLTRLFPFMSYVYRTQKALLIPRLSVEVAARDSDPWQRITVCPVPTTYPKEVPEAKLFALRVGGRELAAFAAPPQVSIILPQSRVSVKADLFVKYSGLRTEERYKLVLTHGHPSAKEGDYEVDSSVIDVPSDSKPQTYVVDGTKWDPRLFPTTVFVAHRFVSIWKERAGILSGRRPQEKAEPNPVRPIEKVIAAQVAAYYGLIAFFGPDPGEAGGDPAGMIPSALMDPSLPGRVPFSANIVPPIIGLPPIVPGNPGTTEVVTNFKEGPHWIVIVPKADLPERAQLNPPEKWTPPPPQDWPPKDRPPIKLNDPYITVVALGPVDWYQPLKPVWYWPGHPLGGGPVFHPNVTPTTTSSTHGDGKGDGCCCCCCCKDGHGSTTSPYTLDVTTIAGGSK